MSIRGRAWLQWSALQISDGFSETVARVDRSFNVEPDAITSNVDPVHRTHDSGIECYAVMQHHVTAATGVITLMPHTQH